MMNGNPTQADPEYLTATEPLCRELRSMFDERLITVMLHGSAVMDDLAPGYGDLDFLAVVADDLAEEDCRRLKDLRRPFREGRYGIFGQMLEGAFLPRGMLDPAVPGKAFWWGTTGERAWEVNKLGWFTLWVIRERGQVLYGRDIRGEIPPPPRLGLAEQVRDFCGTVRDKGTGGGVHSIDWLLTAGRLLLWVREGRPSSKTEAAQWACEHAESQWRRLLPQASAIRRNPAIANSPPVAAWLRGLTDGIQDACTELEKALEQMRA